MTLEESSIFVNLKRLRELLYGAQFHMTKADRIIFGTPLMESVGKSISSFVLAFTVNERRISYLEESVGHFAVLRTDLDFCIRENIIKWKRRSEKLDTNGNPIPWEDPRDGVSTQKVEMFRLVAKIDSDMCRWRASLAKGKTVCDK